MDSGFESLWRSSWNVNLLNIYLYFFKLQALLDKLINPFSPFDALSHLLQLMQELSGQFYTDIATAWSNHKHFSMCKYKKYTSCMAYLDFFSK